MMKRKFDIISVGDPLVDIISSIEDRFLTDNNLTKGGRTLLSEAETTRLISKITDRQIISGGGASNTACGFGKIGGDVLFLGRLSNDEFGRIFKNDLEKDSVSHIYQFDDENTENLQEKTGHCLILITPDAERTMHTCLSTALNFSEHNMSYDDIPNSQIFYFEVSLLQRPSSKAAIEKAVKIAKDSQTKVAINLIAEQDCLKHRELYLEFIKNHVDLVIANETEIMSLTRQSSMTSALDHLSSLCPQSAITMGEKGALLSKGSITQSVSAPTVTNIVDTTGAGDIFASGYLYGLTHGMDHVQSGRLGVNYASEIIKYIGARPSFVFNEMNKDYFKKVA